MSSIVVWITLAYREYGWPRNSRLPIGWWTYCWFYASNELLIKYFWVIRDFIGIANENFMYRLSSRMIVGSFYAHKNNSSNHCIYLGPNTTQVLDHIRANSMTVTISLRQWIHSLLFIMHIILMPKLTHYVTFTNVLTNTHYPSDFALALTILNA